MSSCQPDGWLSDTLLERYWLAERTSEVQTDGPTFEAMPPNLLLDIIPHLAFSAWYMYCTQHR